MSYEISLCMMTHEGQAVWIVLPFSVMASKA